MNKIISELKLNKIHAEILKDSEIIEAIFLKDKKILKVKIKTDHTLPYDVYEALLSKLKLYLRLSVILEVESDKNGLSHLHTMQYYDYFVDKNNLSVLKDTQLSENGDQLVILCNDQTHELQVKGAIDSINRSFESVGIRKKIITNCINPDVKETFKEVKTQPIKPKPQTQTYQGNRRQTSYSNYQFVPLKNLTDEALNIYVEGEIFDVVVREFRNGNGLAATYYLHDGKSAIMLSKIYNDKSLVLNKGMFVRFYGDYKYDPRPFINDYIFNFRRFEEIEPMFERKDLADKKRVEFHLHTKISEMDGVTDIKEYLDQAFAWGHPGLVITDHEGVQSFPKAHQHLRGLKKKYPDHPFKLAYGVEMNLSPDDLSIVRNPKGQNIQSGTYVVFDIETTGLSAYYDHIIEFGGVKIVDGQTVESYQTFVKPPISIPKHIERLTNITDADVAHADGIEKVMPEILEFIGDAVLVAHNASFDIDFMNETLRRLEMEMLDNTVIDTLDLSRALFANRRSYRLGNIARMMKITYDDDVAHRADYDAEILANVFFQMKRMEAITNLKTVDELQFLSGDDGFKKTRKSHLSVIAKNQEGLKSLYELISLSYTKYLAQLGNTSKSNEFLAEPRIIKEELQKRRENLLIGAGCTQSDLFEVAMNKSQSDLEEVMSFYDYVEIMPLSVYKSLLDRNTLQSEAEIIRVIKRIIDTANQLDIMILATGNVHYNHPNDKIVRDVYIHSQGIGGTRHPLYLFDETKRLNTESPDQHFRTTDEMLNEFPYLDESSVYKYVVENPNLLLDEIEQVSPVKEKLYTPELENSDALLKDIVYENAHKIYGEKLPKIVNERLDFELKSILGHGFGVIYYISHLLVKKSLDDGYLVGSRGSVGSSFVATMAEITEVNPLVPHYVCTGCHYHEFFENGEYSSGFDLPEKACPNCSKELMRDGQDIPFETFLGFEGDKVPDIDLNFSGVYQEVAHAYTKELFGEAYVYRAGTISTVAQKTAFGYVQGYYESMNETNDNRAWKSYLAYKAEGVKRTTGQHPGGIIVIPSYMDVHDFTPVQFPANNANSKWLTTHFEFHDIDENVLKLDILGHVDPTAMKMLEEISGVDIMTVPVNDPKTLSLFSSPEALNVDPRTYHEPTGALGIPEFGTPFVRKMLEATKPKNFSDLVRISGLSHGTDVWRNNAEELIKNGLTLQDVIGCRDDIMVYLMQHGLKPKLSFDIMEAVRKGRGLEAAWEKEMNQKQIPSWYIDSCKKIKYMFPKAHAVAYVMMALRVAWFKVHRPLAYYAVYFTLRVTAYEIETMTGSIDQVKKRLHNIKSRLQSFETKHEVTSKEVALVDTLEVTLEMLSRGYKMLPIDLMKSHATEFTIDGDGILPPFNVVDGLGNAVAESIVRAREEREFISKQDLMTRSSISGTLVKKLDDLKVTSHLPETNQLSLF